MSLTCFVCNDLFYWMYRVDDGELIKIIYLIFIIELALIQTNKKKEQMIKRKLLFNMTII